LPQIRVCRKFTKMRQTRICGKPGFAANPDLRQIDVNLHDNQGIAESVKREFFSIINKSLKCQMVFWNELIY